MTLKRPSTASHHPPPPRRYNAKIAPSFTTLPPPAPSQPNNNTTKKNTFLTHLSDDVPSELTQWQLGKASSLVIGDRAGNADTLAEGSMVSSKVSHKNARPKSGHYQKRMSHRKRKLPNIYKGKKRRDSEWQREGSREMGSLGTFSGGHAEREHAHSSGVHPHHHPISIIGSSQNGGIYKSHNLIQHQFQEALLLHLTERRDVGHGYEGLLGRGGKRDAKEGNAPLQGNVPTTLGGKHQVEGLNPHVAVNLALAQCMSAPECKGDCHHSGHVSASFQNGLDLFHEARIVFQSEQRFKEAAICNLNEASVWMERAVHTTNPKHKVHIYQKVDQLLWHAVEFGEKTLNETDRTQVLANIFGNLAETRYQRGDMDQAKSFSLRAIEAFSHLDDSVNSAKMLRLFGLICYAQNNFKDACKYLELYAQTECENAFKYQYHVEQYQQSASSHAEHSLLSERLRPQTAASGNGGNSTSTRRSGIHRRKNSSRKNHLSASLETNPHFSKNVQRIVETFCVLEDAFIRMEDYEAALLTSERAKTFRFVLESKMHFNHYFSWENMTSILNNIEKHIIFYSMTTDHLRIWLVVPLGDHRHKIVFHNVKIGEILGEQCPVRDPFELLAAMMDLGNSVRYDPNQHLYRLLIEPIEGDLPGSALDPVLIVPHWDFSICPFGALLNSRTSRYFIEDHAYVVYSCFQLISLNLLKIQKRDQDRAAIQRILKLSETAMESSDALEVLIITGLISEQRISITLQNQHDVVTSFIHSLLAAKVPTVIATLWNIDSITNAVKTFEKTFYGELEHMSRLMAYRNAVLAVMELMRDRSCIWGAFQMYGVFD
mmetsp:Transcript_10448/g.38856  ORF Transcript_10448/g.38856 Transcript_10448/m.38856 type:complete len:829 (+) Transcript_10448:7896-10382(+)